MQAPESSTAAKKQRSPESPASPALPIRPAGPASFFAELSAASRQPADGAAPPRSRAARSTDRPGDGAPVRPDSPDCAASGATKAKVADAGKPSRPRGRGPGPADASATEPAVETLPLTANIDSACAPAKPAAGVTDRRVASRRADDAPASNPAAREWIRPAWMTQKRMRSLLDSAAQGAQALDPGAASASASAAHPGSIPTRDGSAASPAAAPPAAASPSPVAGRAPHPERGTGGAGLAHDASNLLAALMLYSELLSFPEVLPERYRHYADDLKLLAERSRTLIDRLVSFGGAVDGERTIDKSQVSLVDVVVHCEGLLSTLARGALQVTFGAQAALPVAVAPEALERILVNLVKNAAQATRNGGAVRIGVGLCTTAEGAPSPAASAPPAGSTLALAPPRYRSAARNQGRGPAARANPGNETRSMMLTVDDSGCGMTEEQVARILNPGATPNPDSGADPAPRPASPQRQGIGLRVVRELVLASAGKLGIVSRVGVGTRIEILWPVAEAETAERPSTSSSRPGANPPAAPRAKLQEGTAPSAGDAVPGTVPRMEMIAEASAPDAALEDFAELAGFAGDLSEAERRLLTQTRRQGKRAASTRGPAASDGEHHGEFQGDLKGFNHDPKGAIAC